MRRGRCWWACHYDTKVRAPSPGSQRAAAMGSVVTWNRGMLTAAGSVEFYEDTGRRWLAEKRAVIGGAGRSGAYPRMCGVPGDAAAARD
jgi:hypothetical protein